MQDDPRMNEVRAPDLYGLELDDATRLCYGWALALTINVADMVEVCGWIRRACA